MCFLCRIVAHMRQHEFLYLLADLTDWLQREPTREELSYNYWLNAELFGGSRGDMRMCLRRLVEKDAVRFVHCSPTCHARHIRITPRGRALLGEWNAKGCGAEQKTDEECERPKFNFQRVA